MIGRTARAPADVILLIHTARGELARRMPVLRTAMPPNAGLRIGWPKRASKCRPT
jgi:hypothetical protein